MDIKWTAGPGPAPLPYSKRAREAMGYSDDDKPWAHPDPPAAESLGFTVGNDPLREGRLRMLLFLFVVSIIVVIWAYRRVVKKDENPFLSRSAPTPSHEAPQVSQEEMRLAREARLKRFEEKKSSYADMMQEAAGGWAPEGTGFNGSSDGGGQAQSDGLRHRGTTND